MTELQNRTLICSVLFLDIVEYSRRAVTEQIALKNRLNALLSDALRGVAINDRIILDTGDGAAVSFIGDPEDALFVATALRDAAANEGDPALSTRMGINLGPVRLVKDINGQPNVIGDGINVAQRVMTFAQPGQILVSRSYYEVVSRLSDESSKLFSYQGSRTDKHVREHEVYSVGAIPPMRRREEEEPDWRHDERFAAGGLAARAPRWLRATAQGLAARPPIATALAVAAILILALVVRASREEPSGRDSTVVASSSERMEPPVATAPPAPTQTPSAERPEAPPLPPTPSWAVKPRVADSPPKAAPSPSRAGDSRVTAEGATPAHYEVSISPERDARAAARPARDSASPAVAAAVAVPATVSFAVAPWGEIHVDGKMQGVSPPLQEVQLQPGKHRIEVRNSGAAPHVVEVEAKPGERIRIKHKFD